MMALSYNEWYARVDREMEKEAAFKNLKKAQFRDRLNSIVAAQAAQLQAEPPNSKRSVNKTI